MVSRIYRWTHSVGIHVCNEHCEQCKGEGKKFSWSLEYTDIHILLLYPYVVCLMTKQCLITNCICILYLSIMQILKFTTAHTTQQQQFTSQ